MCFNNLNYVNNLLFRRKIKCTFRLVNVLCFAFFIVFFYMLGIIQLNYYKISFSIFSEKLVPSLSSTDKSFTEINKNKFKVPTYAIELAQEINNQFLVRQRSDNMNITKLFLAISRNRDKIIAFLSDEEKIKVIRLKKEFAEYMSIVQDAVTINSKNQNDTVPKNMSLEIVDVAYKNLEVLKKLGDNYVINRSQLIEILRYEKIRRQDQLRKNTVHTLQKEFLAKKRIYNLTKK